MHLAAGNACSAELSEDTAAVHCCSWTAKLRMLACVTACFGCTDGGDGRRGRDATLQMTADCITRSIEVQPCIDQDACNILLVDGRSQISVNSLACEHVF